MAQAFQQLKHSLSAEKRDLPAFLIIGAQKAGTTSLYRYLSQHPQLAPSHFRKEINYFEKRYFKKSLRWYRSHFEIKQKGNLSFEASTNYLFFPWSPKFIKETLPEVKAIALLRNPVSRAWSHYKHMKRTGEETREFMEALEFELKELGKEREFILENPKNFSKQYRNFSYLDRGKYSVQIQNWQNHFPKNQLAFFTSDEFYADPAGVCGEIFTFLKVPPAVIETGQAYNTSEETKDMPQEARVFLEDFFKPFNQDLEKLLQKKLNW